VTSQDILADRYGTPTPWRRRSMIGACVLVAAVFLGWLAWATYDHATPAVESALVTYSIDGEHRATARMEIRLKDADVRATCLLRAYAEDHSVVGELSFTPTFGAHQPIQRSLRTDRRATSVQLVGCTAPGERRPR